MSNPNDQPGTGESQNSKLDQLMMKNKYLGFYAGFIVFTLPVIIGDLYRDYKIRRKLKSK